MKHSLENCATANKKTSEKLRNMEAILKETTNQAQSDRSSLEKL